MKTSSNTWLRRFSKLTCFSTWVLIFVGGMVTSTGSGLSVPDWPLSYGSFFPPMVGGVFYEHGHRMVASFVGFLTLCLAIWLWRTETRLWVRNLGFAALGAVIAQGLLGGLTVLLFLPPPVSICHGILAQTFFVLTIFLAYSQSIERQKRENESYKKNSSFITISLIVIVLVYIQLILGAIMRHTKSGLAIPDFPTMGWDLRPQFDELMLNRINSWRFDHDLDPVTMFQIIIHFIHRLGALIIFLTCCLLNFIGLKYYQNSNKLIYRTILWLNFAIVVQITLGILTVLTLKSPSITSLHVMTGATTLGLSVLLLLRVAPLTWQKSVEK